MCGRDARTTPGKLELPGMSADRTTSNDPSGRDRRRLKLLLSCLRWGLCIAAVIFLYRAVSWYDAIRLDGPTGPYVRLLESRGENGPFVVQRNGQSETLSRAQVHTIDDRPDIRFGIAGVVRNLDYRWALLAILLFAPVPIMSSQRLQWMLRMQDVPLSLWSAIKLTYAGNFFNFALPGSTGGDLIKAYYLTKYTHRRTEAITTVFLDRVIGLIGLVLVAGIVIVMAWDPTEFGRLGKGLALVVALLVAGASIVLSGRLRKVLGLSALVSKLPGSEHLLRIGRTLTKMRDHLGLTIACLLLTVVLQALVMVSVFVFAEALQMRGDYIHYMIYLPILFLVAALPIAPPQGVGVMEFFAVQFFSTRLGNSVSQAFALALAIRLIQLVWALPGVLVPLLGAHVPRTSELEEFEHVDHSDPADEDARGAEPIVGRVPV